MLRYLAKLAGVSENNVFKPVIVTDFEVSVFLSPLGLLAI